jgi:hypothetical protein
MGLLGEFPNPPPRKPPDGEFGYLRRKKPVACSREDLILRVGQGYLPLIRTVWTPESPFLVSVNEVPYLQEALRRQTAAALRFEFAAHLINTLLSGALTLLVRNLEALIFLGCLALLALSLLSCLLTVRNIRRLTRSS